MYSFIHSNAHILQPNDVNSCAFQPNQTHPCTLFVQNPSIHFSQLRSFTWFVPNSYNKQTNKHPCILHMIHSLIHSFVHSLSKFRLPSVPPAGEIQLYVPHSIIMHVVTENVHVLACCSPQCDDRAKK